MIIKNILILLLISVSLFSQNTKNIFDAINNNDLNSVKNIIASGGNVNVVNKDGLTALTVASEKGNIDIVKELINAGANVNGASSVGWTPLMGACFEGNIEVVKELISAGANVNAFGIKYKNTALMQAIRGENPEIVKILVEAGADINMRNANGETAYDKAMEVGLTEVAGLLKSKPNNYNYSTTGFSTITKVVIMIIIVLIMAIVATRFLTINNELFIGIWTWAPLIFSIIYIITPIDFINGVFEDIVFLLWSIANCIQYLTYNNANDVFDDIVWKATEIIKWLVLSIGLFIALTGGGIFIKTFFILGLILGIAILIIMALICVLSSAAAGAVEVARVSYEVAKPIVKETVKFVVNIIRATLETIADYFRDKYPEATHLEINKITHNIESGNYNKISIGIYDNNDSLLENESITCESIDSSIKEGQIIYI